MNPDLPIRIFVPPDFLDEGQRGLLLPLLRPFYKGGNYSDNQRINDYGVSEKDFYPVVNPNDAGAVVIPMAWEYYLRKGIEGELIRWLQTLPEDKPVWGWNSGDHGVNIPDLPANVRIFRLSAYASKVTANERSMPPFFPDPVKQLNQHRIPLDTESDIDAVRVGFCGQARGNMAKYGLDILRTSYRNLLHYSGLRIYQPHPVISSTLLRHRVLRTLEKDPDLLTDFIKRRKYRAGATTTEARESSRLEFLRNISNNEYTVCLRGGGNFSVRLFETMAMGRIPLQVDTDCVYPLPELINWREQTCFVERDLIDTTGRQLKTFHLSHDTKAIQQKNRRIWTDHLTMKGFFQSEYRVFHLRNV